MTVCTDVFMPSVVETLITIETRPFAAQRFILLAPPKPIASVILFPGGQGDLDLNKDNFLIRTRESFEKHGFQVAVVDAPSDRKSANGMFGGFRTSAEHVADIEAVASHLWKQANVPLWLIGTSRGTESAAHLAIHCREKIAGLILTSAITEPGKYGTAVTHMQLESLKVPVLIVAHREDECKATPASGAERIKDALRQSPEVEILYFEGGNPPYSKPCEPLSAHGFWGIERGVVDAIAAFIKSHIPS